MGEIRLFRKSGNRAHEFEDRPFATERELQSFFEANLLEFVDVHFLVSEHVTGPPHHSRIDSLGLDTDGRPVVIEYKRRSDDNVINQGLYYLDWLRSNESVFRRLVLTRLDRAHAKKIEFANAWLLCVAWEFSEWDFIAARDSRRDIELWQYFRFGDDLVALIKMFPLPDEEVSAPEPGPAAAIEAAPDYETDTLTEAPPPSGPLPDFSMTSGWRSAGATLRSLFMELHDYMLSLGPEIQVLPGRQRIAFKGNFFIVAVYVRSRDNCLLVYASVNPANVKLERGFTRDTQGYPLNHNRLEITIRDRNDLERARPLLRQAWEHDVSGERFRWVE